MTTSGLLGLRQFVQKGEIIKGEISNMESLERLDLLIFDWLPLVDVLHFIQVNQATYTNERNWRYLCARRSQVPFGSFPTVAEPMSYKATLPRLCPRSEWMPEFNPAFVEQTDSWTFHIKDVPHHIAVASVCIAPALLRNPIAQPTWIDVAHDGVRYQLIESHNLYFEVISIKSGFWTC